MEDNRELLRGSTRLWTIKVKETVFANNENIDINKIKSKYHNMKAAWKAAKQMQEQSVLVLKKMSALVLFFVNCKAPTAT